MNQPTSPIPDGYHTLTASAVIRDAAKAIEFYKKALGAEELMRMLTPNGLIMHAEIKIGDSRLMITDEMPEMQCKSPQMLGGSPVTFFVYVPDVDTAFKRALAAGGVQRMPVADQFWGDRCGQFTDPFGYVWMLSTHIRDLSPEQMQRAAQEFMKNAPSNCPETKPQTA